MPCVYAERRPNSFRRWSSAHFQLIRPFSLVNRAPFGRSVPCVRASKSGDVRKQGGTEPWGALSMSAVIGRTISTSTGAQEICKHLPPGEPTSIVVGRLFAL